MLILNPDTVRFGGDLWPHVSSVVIDRAATRLVDDRTDTGPFSTFVDAPEQRITIRIVQELEATDVPGPTLAAAGEFEVLVSPNRSDAQRVRIRTQAVISDLRTDLRKPASAARTITLIALSVDGKTDPIQIDPV